MDWVTVVEKVGLPLAIVAFLLYNIVKERHQTVKENSEREKRMAKRLDELEERYITLAKESLSTAKDSVSALQNNNKMLETFCTTFKRVPCLKESSGLNPGIKI